MNENLARLAEDIGSRFGDRLQRIESRCGELTYEVASADLVEVCRTLRRESDTPIIMLTALAEESYQVAGLELGADDYIAKPFSPRALVARVRANLTTYFAFVDLAALSAFAVRGLVDRATLLEGLLLAPAVIAGGILGGKLFPLASDAFYRRLAMLLLVGVAIGALIL